MENFLFDNDDMMLEMDSPNMGFDDSETLDWGDDVDFHSDDISFIETENPDGRWTNHGDQISFGRNDYSDAEISRMKSDVERAEYDVTCAKNEMKNWESKVSLNDTKEHRENGDYAHCVRKLSEAQSRYNDTVSRYNSAKAKLNNAL